MSDLFAGTTILEFGGGAAGPVATRYFADHGATVIRVESRQRPDFLRILQLTPNTPGGIDGGEHFAVLNANKLSVALNLSTPEGVARGAPPRARAPTPSRRTSRRARWRSGGSTTRRWCRERPDLVMISTCLNGQTGPQRFYPGFGGQGSALSGFNHLTGWPDREPVGPYGTITDSLSPRFAALLLAVGAAAPRAHRAGPAHRPVAGRGRHRLPLREHRHLHRQRRRCWAGMGNRSRHAAPHGVFRCADEDGRERWIAIAVHDDADWQRLVHALGRPGVGRRPGARDRGRPPRARRRARGAARGVDAPERAPALAERAPARRRRRRAASHDLGDLHDDPQLAHRAALPHGRASGARARIRPRPTRSASPPWRPSLRRAAPRLGEHTDTVLRDLLAMPPTRSPACAPPASSTERRSARLTAVRWFRLTSGSHHGGRRRQAGSAAHHPRPRARSSTASSRSRCVTFRDRTASR